MGNVFVRKSLRLMLTLTVTVGFTSWQSLSAADRTAELAQSVGIRILSEATSDDDVRDRAASRIPYHKMSPGARSRAAELVDSVSQYRRMPSLQYEVDPDIYRYFINHPDVAISTWRVMGISKLEMWQTEKFRYSAKCGDGSEGTADVLWQDQNQCLFIVQGTYRSPLLPNVIQASALVWLQYRFVTARDGSVRVNQQIETFVNFPSPTIETLARLASRLTNSILDRNVLEVSLYARMMSRAAEKEPHWIEELATRLDGVPEQRKTELIQIARTRSSAQGQSEMVNDIASPRAAEKKDSVSSSGEFQTFEDTLRQLGPSPALTGTQSPAVSYMTIAADAGSTDDQSPAQPSGSTAQTGELMIRDVTSYSNPDGKGIPAILTPTAVPPSAPLETDRDDAALPDMMPPLSFPQYTRQRSDDRKATTVRSTADVSAPLHAERRRMPTQSAGKTGAAITISATRKTTQPTSEDTAEALKADEQSKRE